MGDCGAVIFFCCVEPAETLAESSDRPAKVYTVRQTNGALFENSKKDS